MAVSGFGGELLGVVVNDAFGLFIGSAGWQTAVSWRPHAAFEESKPFAFHGGAAAWEIDPCEASVTWEWGLLAHFGGFMQEMG